LVLAVPVQAAVARAVMRARAVRAVTRVVVLPELAAEVAVAVQPELSVMVLINTVAEVQAEAVSAFLVRVLTEQPVPAIIQVARQLVAVVALAGPMAILFPVVRPALLEELTAEVAVAAATFSACRPFQSCFTVLLVTGVLVL
jgi:hypothetical protein